MGNETRVGGPPVYVWEEDKVRRAVGGGRVERAVQNCVDERAMIGEEAEGVGKRGD